MGMTKKQSIDYLKDLWNEVYNEDSDGYDYAEAIDMAIESLKKDIERHEMVIRASEHHLGIVHGHCEADKDDLIRREDAIKEMLRAHPMPSEFLKSLDIPSSCFEAGFRAAYFAVERTPSADSVSTEYAIECIDQCRERKNREITIIRERKNREIAELKKQLADRPTGEWITCGTETGALGVSYAEKKCSHCGWAHSLLIPSNYCPNCGAMMVKESE